MLVREIGEDVLIIRRRCVNNMRGCVGSIGCVGLSIPSHLSPHLASVSCSACAKRSAATVLGSQVLSAMTNTSDGPIKSRQVKSDQVR